MEELSRLGALSVSNASFALNSSTSEPLSFAGDFLSVHTRYSTLWSLYNTLDSPTISRLEKAILYSELRTFEQSLAIFYAFPTELKHHPVIAFEHGMTHWRQWRLFDAAERLEGSLEWAEENGKDIIFFGLL